MGCDFDAIDQVPDFLDLFHRFSNGLCAEVDKAKIPTARSPDDCLRAKQERDRLVKAYEASFVSKLSQQDQTGYILQMNAARDYLPKKPEMCSPEWIAEEFPDPTPIVSPQPYKVHFMGHTYTCSALMEIAKEIEITTITCDDFAVQKRLSNNKENYNIHGKSSLPGGYSTKMIFEHFSPKQ